MTRAEKVAQGISILSKYPGLEVAAEHDQFYFGPSDDSLVLDEDKKLLEDLGWFLDEGFGWSRFV